MTTQQRVEALINVLSYAVDRGNRTQAEYRTRGKGAWKLLPLDPKFVNMNRYEYRTATGRLWLLNSEIHCEGGGMPTSVAQRILKIASKRPSFYLCGYEVSRRADGGLIVGCQTFSKEDVTLAKQLLKVA